MKTRIGIRASLLAVFICGVVHAQESPSSTESTAQVNAETEKIQAQIARRKAQNELQALENAPADAATKKAEEAAAKKKEQELATLNAIAALGEKMPAGSYSGTADGVATPLGMSLAFANLDAAGLELAGQIGQAFKLEKDSTGKEVKTGVLVVTDTLPAVTGSLESVMYAKQMEDIIADAKKEPGIPDVDKEPGASAQLAAAAVITALPGILNAIAGLTRVDVTEKIFSANIGSGTAASVMIGKLLQISPGPKKIHLSLEAFVSSSPVELTTLELVQNLEKIRKLDGALRELAKGEDLTAEEAKVTKTSTAVELNKGKVKAAEFQRDLASELAKLNPTNPAPYEQKVVDLTAQIATLKADQVALDKALEDAKAALTAKGEKKTRINAICDRISKLMASLASTDGTPPLFIRLVRDALLKNALSPAKEVCFLTVTVVSSVQGTVTKKSFFSHSAYTGSLIALEYRLIDRTGTVLQAGVLPLYQSKSLFPDPPAPPPSSRPPSKR